MKREKIFLCIVIGLIFLATACSEKKDMALERKMQRALDYMEIQNVMAKHTYYYAAQEQWLELDTVWAKKRDDISYGHNQGYYYGRKSVENYYGQANEDRRKLTLEALSKIYPEVANVKENEGVGDLVLHPLTTPVIEIAEDGQTAKGVWVSNGLAVSVNAEGNAQRNWFWEKFAVDFVKEDGEWKIWHFQIYTDFSYGDAQGPPQFSKFIEMDKSIQMYENYSPTRVPTNEPTLPEPYKTWSDTTPYIK